MILFVHLSDFHVGERLRWRGTFQPPPANRAPTSLPSKAGHDESVALGLTNELQRIRKYYADAELIVGITGDLTRTGLGTQFGLAHRYIHANWLVTPGTPLWLGLGMGGCSALTIPGNHDFWSGTILNPLLGRGVLEPHYWPMPWIHAVSDPDGGFELHVVGLDSCSGLANLTVSQVVATGAIAPTQLNEAEGLFDTWKRRAAKRGLHVIRAVMVHHPPRCLTSKSKAAFDAWLKSNEVCAILTGHTHEASQAWIGADTFELRCGTSLQAGTITTLPGRRPNHFYVHSLSAGPNGLPDIEWRTLEYEHSGLVWSPNNVLAWDQNVTAL